MTFKFDNYSVLFEKTGLHNRTPNTLTPTADFPNIKVLGVVGKDSSYKIEPSEVITDSLGEEVVISYKMEAEIKVQSELSAETIALIDSELISLVLVPKTTKVNLNSADFSSNNVVTSAKILITKPATAKLSEDVKFGSHEINPLVIKLSTIANTKAELIKEFTVADDPVSEG